MGLTHSTETEAWDDVTTLGLPEQPAPGSRVCPVTQTEPAQTHGEARESGTQRVARKTLNPTVPPVQAELLAADKLGPDELGSIIANYVACLNRADAALHVHETLERLGLLGGPVPQPLAGHLVLCLANHIECPDARSDFLAHSWGILGATSSPALASNL